MKKLTNIFLYLTLITVISCDNFVEIEPDGSNADNYFNSEEEYLDALIGAYDLLQGTFWNTLTALVASDDYAAGGDPFNYDQPTLQNINLMIHTPDDENQLRDIWGLMYAGINRANYVLENKDKTDFAGKDGIIAEAYFLRAYFAFELVKFFGDIPLVIDERLGVQQIQQLERTPASEVYAQIEKDLNDAIAILSYKSESTHSGIKGRVDKGAALGLLGKVYLYQENWTAASQTLNTLISSGNYSLASDYNTIFLKENENNSETVFDVEYSDQEGGSYGCLICLEGNLTVGYQGIRQYDGEQYGDGNSYNLPTQNLYDFFEYQDPRREATCLNIDQFIADNSPGTTYGVGAGGHTGFYNNKYIILIIMESDSEILTGGDDNNTEILTSIEDSKKFYKEYDNKKNTISNILNKYEHIPAHPLYDLLKSLRSGHHGVKNKK